MKLESTRISNAEGNQRVVENPSMYRYKQFQTANNIINNLCEIDTLYLLSFFFFFLMPFLLLFYTVLFLSTLCCLLHHLRDEKIV